MGSLSVGYSGRVIRRTVLVGVVLALSLAASAQARTVTVTATTERHEIRLAGELVSSSYYVTGSPRTFVAYSPTQPFCRDFGRFGDVRVKESSCVGPPTITIRSVGEPAEVTISLTTD